MDKELQEEYLMLKKAFKKLGGEEEYDKLVKKGKEDLALMSVREKLIELEYKMSAKEIIECSYKFIEK